MRRKFYFRNRAVAVVHNMIAVSPSTVQLMRASFYINELGSSVQGEYENHIKITGLLDDSEHRTIGDSVFDAGRVLNSYDFTFYVEFKYDLDIRRGDRFELGNKVYTIENVNNLFEMNLLYMLDLRIESLSFDALGGDADVGLYDRI